MRQPLLIGLACVLGLTLWLSSQDEGDGEIEVMTRQGAPAAAPPSADAAPSPSAVPSAPVGRDRQPGQAASTDGWIRQAMLEGVQGWTRRRTEAAALPPERPMTSSAPSAWASQQPPPPPPPPQGASASAPVAPRFPHNWVGRVNDDAVQRAVLTGAVNTWVVRAGDVIEGQWRIDRIQERTMTLTYLPLAQSQTVSMK